MLRNFLVLSLEMMYRSICSYMFLVTFYSKFAWLKHSYFKLSFSIVSETNGLVIIFAVLYTFQIWSEMFIEFFSWRCCWYFDAFAGNLVCNILFSVTLSMFPFLSLHPSQCSIHCLMFFHAKPYSGIGSSFSFMSYTSSQWIPHTDILHCSIFRFQFGMITIRLVTFSMTVLDNRTKQ